MDKKSLFKPVVEEKRLHESLVGLIKEPGAEAARRMADDVFQDFDDPEGNFLEQFQTTGFDSRHFELYLYAYLSRSGFKVDRSHERPDFLVERDGVRVALEATTVNPSQAGALAEHGKELSELSASELDDWLAHEIPIRFGGPLFSKLKEEYWELEHCKGLPFVIAIQTFHEARSLLLSSNGLSRFLYGLTHIADRGEKGKLEVRAEPVEKHVVGKKEVASNFFGQPGTEHLSAVLFSNSGTNTKCARMGYQCGYGCDAIDISRVGFAFNPDPDALCPTFFSYNLDEPPVVESWGQGLEVLLNPNATCPLPLDFFVDAAQSYLVDGQVATDHFGWHPISSMTTIVHWGELKQKLPKQLRQKGRLAVAEIPKNVFQASCGFAIAESNPLVNEQAWFADETQSFIGVVFQDKIDGDWGSIVMARDQYFQFRPIDTVVEIESLPVACQQVQMRIGELLAESQRIFPQSP